MTNSNKTMKHGIITGLDVEYIYVWAEYLCFKELRFHRRSDIHFQPGEVVSFYQDKADDQIQMANNLMKKQVDIDLESSVEIVKGNLEFKITTMIVFPPSSYKPYVELAQKVTKCRGIAFSKDFGPIAMLSNFGMDYTPGILYTVGFCRFPRNQDAAIQELKTLFYALGTEIRPVIAPQILQETLKMAPWTEHIGCQNMSQNLNMNLNQNNDEDDDLSFGLQDELESEAEFNGRRPCREQFPYSNLDDPISSNTNFNSTNVKANNASAKINGFASTPTTNTVTKVKETTQNVNTPSSRPTGRQFISGGIGTAPAGAPHGSNEGLSIGLIVTVTDNVIIIWNQSQGYVRADIAAKDIGQYPVASFVSYRVIREQFRDPNGLITGFTAYDVKPCGNGEPRKAYSSRPIVKVHAFLHRIMPTSSPFDAFVSVEDEWLGPVLCTKDEFVLQQLQSGETVEAMTLNSNRYYVKWIVFAVKEGCGRWRKITDLPEPIQDRANMAFRECPMTSPFAGSNGFSMNEQPQFAHGRNAAEDVDDQPTSRDSGNDNARPNSIVWVSSDSNNSSDSQPEFEHVSDGQEAVYNGARLRSVTPPGPPVTPPPVLMPMPVLNQNNSIVEHLDAYRPTLKSHKNHGTGIVVEKRNKYALIYSSNIDGDGLAIAVPKQFPNNEVLLADEFLACEPGTWIRFSYMPIDGESLRNSIRSASEQVVPYIYKYIVVSPLEPQKLLDAVNLPAAQFHSQTGILQVKVRCDFQKLTSSSKGRVLAADFGKIVLDANSFTVPILHNLCRTHFDGLLWITYVPGAHHWLLDRNTEENRLMIGQNGISSSGLAASGNFDLDALL